MTINVKFVGALRRISSSDIQTVDCGECSVKELVQKITRRSPTLRRNIVAGERTNERPNSLILVNGKEISVLDGLETALKDGDEVVFVPVIHGG